MKKFCILRLCGAQTQCLRKMVAVHQSHVCDWLSHLPRVVQPHCLYHQYVLHIWRSLHSPLFSGRTPGGLRRTQPIQNANFLALELLELSGDFPVTFRCMLAGLVSPTDFSGGQSGRNITKPADSPPEITGQQRKVQQSPADSSGKSNGVQRTTSRLAYLLVLLIK